MFLQVNYFTCVLLAIFMSNEGAKITRSAQKSVMKNGPHVYQGQVFILRETDDSNSPFVAELVNGSIEMVQQSAKPAIAIPAVANKIRANESLPDVLEDPEYFAVMVTPETAALTQISTSAAVQLPLSMVLTAFSKRMPWVLVLKRRSHLEYFRSVEPSLLPSHQLPMMLSQRRRSRSISSNREPKFVFGSQQYELVYSEKDKAILQNICMNVVEELAILNALMAQQTNNTEPYEFVDQFNTNEAKYKSERKHEIDVNYEVPRSEPLKSYTASSPKPLIDKNISEKL